MILHLFAFVCVSLHLCALVCVLRPTSQSMKICVCLGLRFVFVNTPFNCNPLLRHPDYRDQKINENFFWTKFFESPRDHGRPHQKSWTSAPKSAFSCGPGGGEKLVDPWASGRKGQECPQEIRTKKLIFMLILLP